MEMDYFNQTEEQIFLEGKQAISDRLINKADNMAIALGKTISKTTITTFSEIDKTTNPGTICLVIKATTIKPKTTFSQAAMLLTAIQTITIFDCRTIIRLSSSNLDPQICLEETSSKVIIQTSQGTIKQEVFFRAWQEICRRDRCLA